jgi:hypothetical protein
MVNNSDAKRNLQTLQELREENNPREQSRHSHWYLDWGNLDKVPGGWEFVGDDGAYGDDYVCHSRCVGYPQVNIKRKLTSVLPSGIFKRFWNNLKGA